MLEGLGRGKEPGGLMSYGENFAAMYWRAAYFVDRIFKGTKPADLPVEQAAKFSGVPGETDLLLRNSTTGG
jgi:hypothetical protein